MSNFDTFAKVYAEELAIAVRDHPEDYRWLSQNVSIVAAKMTEAFRKGTYKKNSRAIKQTCKRLNIKYTYKAINSYLSVPEVV